MRNQLIIYWVWHLSAILLANFYVTTDIEVAKLVMHFNFLSLWFLCGYPMYKIHVMQERIDQKYLWYFIGSLTVRAAVFHAQIMLGQSMHLCLGLYCFGMVAFILLDKTFNKVIYRMSVNMGKN